MVGLMRFSSSPQRRIDRRRSFRDLRPFMFGLHVGTGYPQGTNAIGALPRIAKIFGGPYENRLPTFQIDPPNLSRNWIKSLAATAPSLSKSKSGFTPPKYWRKTMKSLAATAPSPVMSPKKRKMF